MNDLTNRGPMGLKPEKAPKDPDRLTAVRNLPCCICHEYWMPQFSPTQAHHCIHGRFSEKKAPDNMSIPLCEGHHLGLLDTSKIAIHNRPSEWKRLYGEDTRWISWTEERLNT